MPIVDTNLYRQAGVKVKTKHANSKIDDRTPCSPLLDGIKLQLSILDEQNAINRLTHYNLPDISSQELERLLYFTGPLCMFQYEYEKRKKWYYLPYALDGTIDFYGRYNTVHPVPFSSGGEKENHALKRVLSTLKLRVIHEVPFERIPPEEAMRCCVIIRDYTNGISQSSISRSLVQAPIIDAMSRCIPYMSTALKNATGVQGLVVGGEEEQSNVKAANQVTENAALNGERWIAIVNSMQTQELSAGNVGKAEDFLIAMQSLDNYRLSLLGLDNGGIFEKKAHMLQDEQDMNANTARSAMIDALRQRQKAWDIANALWGLGISVEVTRPDVELGDYFEEEAEQKNELINDEGGEIIDND